jgi:hypothetical protein
MQMVARDGIPSQREVLGTLGVLSNRRRQPFSGLRAFLQGLRPRSRFAGSRGAVKSYVSINKAALPAMLE